MIVGTGATGQGLWPPENGPADRKLMSTLLGFRASQAQTGKTYRFSVWHRHWLPWLRRSSGIPPSQALQTKKRKLDGRNETDVVRDLTTVSMKTPVMRHRGVWEPGNGLAGFAQRASFPVTVKQSPSGSHGSLELVE